MEEHGTNYESIPERCSICHTWSGEDIMFCSAAGCNIVVHGGPLSGCAQCFHPQGREDWDWFCDGCLLGEKPTDQRCDLCGKNAAFAMGLTTQASWVHIFCARWLLGKHVESDSFASIDIRNTEEGNGAARGGKTACIICSHKGPGKMISCAHANEGRNCIGSSPALVHPCCLLHVNDDDVKAECQANGRNVLWGSDTFTNSLVWTCSTPRSNYFDCYSEHMDAAAGSDDEGGGGGDSGVSADGGASHYGDGGASSAGGDDASAGGGGSSGSDGKNLVEEEARRIVNRALNAARPRRAPRRDSLPSGSAAGGGSSRGDGGGAAVPAGAEFAATGAVAKAAALAEMERGGWAPSIAEQDAIDALWACGAMFAPWRALRFTLFVDEALAVLKVLALRPWRAKESLSLGAALINLDRRAAHRLFLARVVPPPPWDTRCKRTKESLLSTAAAAPAGPKTAARLLPSPLHQTAEVTLRTGCVRLHFLRRLCNNILGDLDDDAEDGLLEAANWLNRCVGCGPDAGWDDCHTFACCECGLRLHEGCGGLQRIAGGGEEGYGDGEEDEWDGGGDEYWCGICSVSNHLRNAVFEGNLAKAQGILAEPALGVLADPTWSPANDDVGAARDSTLSPAGATALHWAAAHGAYDSLSMLLHFARAKCPPLPLPAASMPRCCRDGTPYAEALGGARSPECARLLQLTFSGLPTLLPMQLWRSGLDLGPDISCGREPVRIPWVNEVDGEVFPGDRFTYITHSIEGPGVCLHFDLAATATKQPAAKGCSAGNCSHGHGHGGLHVECNFLCHCQEAVKRHQRGRGIGLALPSARDCPNRRSQRGVMVKMVVFKTARMGWGVRAAQNIDAHTFLCVYAGEIITEAEADWRQRCVYDDHSQPLYGYRLSKNRRGADAENLVIDATHYRNVAAFFNHSCSDPNVEAKLVPGYRKVMVPNSVYSALDGVYGYFTKKAIAAGTELLLNYSGNNESSDKRSFKCQCAQCCFKRGEAAGPSDTVQEGGGAA